MCYKEARKMYFGGNEQYIWYSPAGCCWKTIRNTVKQKRKTKYRNRKIQNTEIEKYLNTFEAMNNLSGGAVLGGLERQSEIQENNEKKNLLQK